MFEEEHVMANEREYHEDLGQTKRISPYQEPMSDQSGYDEKEYRQAYDQEEDLDYDHYAGEEYEDDEQESQGGFLSTTIGKLLLGVIALLVVVLVALLVVRFVSSPKTAELPEQESTTQQAPAALPGGLPQENEPQDTQETAKPGLIVFSPSMQQPTDAPTQAPTDAPQETQSEPTATPLPIILTNTPTPSPTPTMTPTPSPTFTPAPTATPEPTKAPEIGTGKVNRDANLRESAASNGKVKETVSKGETVTIHETTLDQDNKVWYMLTVDDMATSGWMRDYVVDADEKLAKPTHTPKPTATPDAEEEAEEEPAQSEITPEPTQAPEGVVGTAVTRKEANVRKVMNGKVLVQLRKGKKVDILGARTDKNGDLWYHVRPQGSTTEGFVRDYLLDLDDDAKIALPTATPKATATPEPTAVPEEEKTEETAPAEEEKEESILDREVIGRARTNREANVRVKPVAGAKLVRQLSKGVDLLILDKYQDDMVNFWYEVATESGRTHGFVRDYLLDFEEMDDDYEAKLYEAE